MSSAARAFTGVAATRTGQTGQVNRAFKGMADEMKSKKVDQLADSDHLNRLTHRQLVSLVFSLQNKLIEKQATVDEMRAEANSDAPIAAASTAKYWDTKRMAKESGVAVCTICRNADTLGGIKLGGDWLFPAGTTYGKKRQRK